MTDTQPRYIVREEVGEDAAYVESIKDKNTRVVKWGCNDRGVFDMNCTCGIRDCVHQRVIVRSRIDRLHVVGDGLVFRTTIPIVLPTTGTPYATFGGLNWRHAFNICASTDGLHEVEWIRYWAIGSATRAGRHVEIGFIGNNACRDDILQLVRPYVLDEALSTACVTCGWTPWVEVGDKPTEMLEDAIIRDWWFMLNNSLMGKNVPVCIRCCSSPVASAYGDDLIPSV